MQNTGKLFIIAAPSGTGKTTIALETVKQLATRIPIERIVTYTTRPMRKGEVDGIDYFFIDKITFLKKTAQNFFLEVTNYNGQCYGSPRFFINEMKAGKSFVMVTDRSGAISLTHTVPNTVTIWLTPPSLRELEQRLKNRGTENNEEIRRRLNIAQQEILIEQGDPIFDVHLINDVLENTIAEVCALIERHVKQIDEKKP